MAVYTTIDDPSAHFQTTLYTGNAADRSITNTGNSNLQPDFVWIKPRNATFDHLLQNSTTGVTKYVKSNTSGAEQTASSLIQAFQTDGFSLSAGGSWNQSGQTNVAWQWKANGGTRSTFTESGNNPGGGYQVNTTAGFSLVDYTGTGGAGTVSHGLSAIPKVIITRRRTGTSDWNVYHASNTSAPETDFLTLNLTDATSDATRWNDTAPTTSVFSLGSDEAVNGDAETYLAFVFADVQGYSKFGGYTGNGDADGAFIYTGFKPAFVLIRRTDATNNWLIYDHKRTGYNPKQNKLYPDDTSAEDASSTSVDLLSNGFKLRADSASQNASSGNYIYMAFAENPFVTSTGTPTTAR